MSYPEKRIWMSLAIFVAVFGFYFSRAIPVLSGPAENHPSLIGLFIGVVIAFVIVQIVLHTLLTIFNLHDADRPDDERDKLIELRAIRLSYFILVAGVFTAGISLLQAPSALVVANIVMAFMVLGEIVASVFQLICYRRGFLAWPGSGFPIISAPCDLTPVK